MKTMRPNLRLPAKPWQSLFFAAFRGAKKASGAPARDGDIVANWESLDGKVELDAAGSIAMRNVEYLGGTRQMLEYDGASGFELPIDSSINTLAQGLAVCGFRRTSVAGGGKNVLMATSNNTTTTRLTAFYQQQVASANPGIAIDGVIRNGLTSDAQVSTPGAAGGRVNAFQNRIWLCNGSYRLFNDTGEIGVSGSGNNGAFINSGDSFQHNWLTLGFLRRSTGDIYHVTGHMAYAGWFDLMSVNQRIRMNRFLHLHYPADNYLFLGDSRFNTGTNQWLRFEDTNFSRGHAANIHEVATGGNTVALCQAAWDAIPNSEPETVVLHVGINDIIADRDGDDIADEHDALVDSIVARSRVRRLRVFDETAFGNSLLNNWTAARQAEMDKFRARIAAKVAATPKASIFNSWDSMEDPGNLNSMRLTDHTGDELHYSTAGYDRLSGDFADAEGW